MNRAKAVHKLNELVDVAGWKQRTIVITGATRGIGRVLAETAIEGGAKVGCIARSAPELEELEASASPGKSVAVCAADVGDRESINEALDTLESRLGPIDVLVNNAGVGLYGPVRQLDPWDAERLMRINYLGVVYACCNIAPKMMARKSGHIVNIGSIAGRIGAPFEAAYSGSKFAVVGFTESLAMEASAFGVSVSLVNPGPVDTGFFDSRGHPYKRQHPKPVMPEQVVAEILEVIERDRFEGYVPRTLRSAVVVRHMLPRVYEKGTRFAFRREIKSEKSIPR